MAAAAAGPTRRPDRLAPFTAWLRATGLSGDVVLCDFGSPGATREALAAAGVSSRTRA